MKYILMGIVAISLVSGCNTTKLDKNIELSRLVHSAEFMTVDDSILDDETVHTPFYSHYDSTYSKEYLIDSIGRVVDAQGIAVYRIRKSDRNKTFDEVPMMWPLISKWIVNDIGNMAFMKTYDQLGREVKIQAL